MQLCMGRSGVLTVTYPKRRRAKEVSTVEPALEISHTAALPGSLSAITVTIQSAL